MSKLNVYRFTEKSLHGIFLADDEALEMAREKRLLCRFGKEHGNISCVLDRGNVCLVSADPEFVKLVAWYGMEKGINPLQYLTDEKG